MFAKSVEEVYALSRRFLIPGVTYETPARERKEILDRFREGRYRAIIASDVLNEGVDVPDAGVAVILAFINPGYLNVFVEHPIGLLMLVGGFILFAVGGFWMSRVVKIKF